ncbi:MAG: MerR family transcriptional regulator [Chitinophagaceae bacterium]|jgi:DNA-binding transcriptional MerR regulator|nr:MerR family transcriptional regulator [Chitinophagaceae bacterium]
MLAVQLELFGAPPKPPAKIRQDDPEISAVPATDNQSGKLPSESAESTALNDTDASVAVADAGILEEKQSWGVHVMMPGNNSFNRIVTVGLYPTNTPENDEDNQNGDKTAPISINKAVAQAPDEKTGNEQEPKTRGFDQQNDIEAAVLTGEVPDNGSEQAKALPQAQVKTVLVVEEAGEPQLKNEPLTPYENTETGNLPGMAKAADEKIVPDNFGTGIPDKETLHKRQYYTMRETADMFGVNQSMLRYWENEFIELRPRKNRKGDRYFRPQDIETLQLIFHLLKVRKFTIDGAKDYLKQNKKAFDTFELIQKLEKLKIFLTEIRSNL